MIPAAAATTATTAAAATYQVGDVAVSKFAAVLLGMCDLRGCEKDHRCQDRAADDPPHEPHRPSTVAMP
ncbi:protein of unknown function [Micropruina glycogenica]|uniref:Uncharacterized protein n=1 Tax=Micropruina glycogenica TaxID=75385 RepID=A0A2N9JE60_9ACTN|nr:protein of unknown function [Micropruina glycogenica]